MPAETAPPRRGRGPLRRILLAVAQAVAGLVLLAVLFRTLGTDSARSAVGVLSPLTVVLALLAGLVATAAQAQRWRLVARGRGARFGLREALGECWAAGLVNLLLPGGVTGDAVRVLRRRRRGDTWPGAGGSVVGERLAGTSVLLAAGVVPALAVGPWVAAAFGAGALAVGAVAWRATSGSPARDRAAVWSLSVLAWACYQGLFLLAALRTAPQAPLPDLWGTTVLGLAGMSVPVGVGGWGPREGITTLAAMAHGLPAGTGFAISLGYGLLALISALPGAVVLARWLLPRRAAAGAARPRGSAGRSGPGPRRQFRRPR
ncbi:lysylphosphatidylglycerol synthase domain-containing protein [Kocuria sp. SM24M-10]|uniref:lysylphosphatidylglycerol synthase domain-containing protein n=1 Tax=Kocuria sp. SM24M-10 TaxID=1660349 RepID=UPI00069A79EB|nr:lysylphosphatidylglycerol synthase domain-containing protein [Kocuria sp. SM24M-10]